MRHNYLSLAKFLLFYFQDVEMSSTKKRGGCQGFDGVKGKMTTKCIKLWTKNTVECDWRTVHNEKICYTLIHRTFTYGVNSFEQTFISACGMKQM